MSDKWSDTEGLVRKAREDPDAFAALFERLRGRLHMWITLRMGPLLRARLSPDDVLQETFLQVHRSLDAFCADGPDSFRRWVFSVAENRIRDLHKFHTRQARDARRDVLPRACLPEESAVLERLSDGGETPSAVAAGRELRERLVAAIERLPELLRPVLLMRALEERTFQEIADSLGCRRATVQARFVRALRSLRDELADGA